MGVLSTGGGARKTRRSVLASAPTATLALALSVGVAAQAKGANGHVRYSHAVSPRGLAPDPGRFRIAVARPPRPEALPEPRPALGDARQPAAELPTVVEGPQEAIGAPPESLQTAPRSRPSPDGGEAVGGPRSAGPASAARASGLDAQQAREVGAGDDRAVLGAPSNAPRAHERLNVVDPPFLARGDGAADDSAALAAAIAAANARADRFQQVCVYLPGARYRIAATALPTFRGNGCVEGDGTNQTYVVVDRAYDGDVFSWDDAWLATNYFVHHGATAELTGQGAGPHVEGLTIVGDTTSPNLQNALMFYDRADFAYMRDVDVLFMHGRCFATGLKRHVRASAMRESMFDATRFWGCGTPSLPAVEIGSDGLDADDATNEIDWRALSIDAPNGPGLVIRNRGGSVLRAIRIQGLRVEGSTGVASAGDLVRVGDAAASGRIADVSIDDLQTNASQPGYAALRFAAPQPEDQPFDITVRGAIGNGAGEGLVIEAGRGLRFDLRGIATGGTNVRVGASPRVGSDIVLNSWGQERFYTYNIDPSAAQSFRTPGPMIVGDPSRPAAGAIVADPHDGSAAGGLSAGGGAIDLQTNRGDATRVAAGLDSVVAGGIDNRAGASYGVQVGGQSNVDESFFGAGLGGQGNRQAGFADVIAGGTFNALEGPLSSVLGGSRAADRGRYGWQGFASGAIAGQGDAQAGAQVLRASGTAAMRLTADGGAAGPANCVNIPDDSAYGLKILLQARDPATPTATYTWSVPVGTLSRSAGPDSTRLMLGTPAAVGAGTVSAEADLSIGVES